MKLKIFSTIILSAIFLCLYFKTPLRVYEGFIFGTYYKIKVLSKQDVNKQIADSFLTINQELSVFNKDSSLSKLNNSKQIKASKELIEVMSISKDVYNKSQGAFDPTLSPLIELWGFGINKEKKQPTKKEIAKALKTVGLNKVNIINDHIIKANKDTQINLSAIAKGYAVDIIAKALDKEGIKNYLIDIGGEVKLKGKNKGKMWKIGLANPIEPTTNTEILELTDICVATSGDYHNYFTKAGKKYSHTINPLTGYPVLHNLASISVFHSSCTLADAYATAIMAMGEIKAQKFIKDNNLKTIIILHNKKTIKTGF